MDELIGNLYTYKLNRKQGGTRKQSNKENTIALKSSQSEMTEQHDKMENVTKMFQKIIKKTWRIPKERINQRSGNN